MPERLECEVLQKERYINTLNMQLMQLQHNAVQFATAVSVPADIKVFGCISVLEIL